MPVAWDDILLAFEFVSTGESDNTAFLCRETGEMFWHSEFGDNSMNCPRISTTTPNTSPCPTQGTSISASRW